MGSDDALMQYNKMAGVVSSVKDLADQRVAEWASVQNNLKDDMAAEAMKAQAGNKTKQTGLNLLTSAAANYDMGNLYKTKNRDITRKPGTTRIRVTSPTAEYDSPQETIRPYTRNDYPNPLEQLPSWMGNDELDYKYGGQ
jgi:hypothetical protein